MKMIHRNGRLEVVCEFYHGTITNPMLANVEWEENSPPIVEEVRVAHKACSQPSHHWVGLSEFLREPLWKGALQRVLEKAT